MASSAVLILAALIGSCAQLTGKVQGISPILYVELFVAVTDDLVQGGTVM